MAVFDLFDVNEVASLSCATQADCAASILESRVSVPRYLDQQLIVQSDSFHVPTMVSDHPMGSFRLTAHLYVALMQDGVAITKHSSEAIESIRQGIEPRLISPLRRKGALYGP